MGLTGVNRRIIYKAIVTPALKPPATACRASARAAGTAAVALAESEIGPGAGGLAWRQRLAVRRAVPLLQQLRPCSRRIRQARALLFQCPLCQQLDRQALRQGEAAAPTHLAMTSWLPCSGAMERSPWSLLPMIIRRMCVGTTRFPHPRD